MLSIILADTNPAVIDAWKLVGKNDYPSVSTYYGSIFDCQCDAVVSPANSFGYMDGGIDYFITQRFGGDLQERLQELIRTKHCGELLVGAAEVIPTMDGRIPYLVSAPTMRVPSDISRTVNAYLAVRAVLIALEQETLPCGVPVSDRVKVVAFPGMGTGCGGLSPIAFAQQFKSAIDEVTNKSYESRDRWTGLTDFTIRHLGIIGG